MATFKTKVLSMMVISICRADTIFRYLKQDTNNLHQNKVKVWHNYTKHFLEKYLLREIQILKTYEKCVFYLFQLSKAIKGKNTRNFDFKSLIQPQQVLYRDGNLKLILFNVTYPVGMFSYKNLKYNVLHFSFYIERSQMLNLTFDIIYFPVEPAVCHKHHLFITNYTGSFYYSYNVSSYWRRIFCGHYSPFNFYPPVKPVTIGLFHDSIDNTMQLKCRYMVMDKNVVININKAKVNIRDLRKGRNNGFESDLTYISFYSKSQVILRNFLLKTVVTYKLSINFDILSSSQFLVIDGPGFLSPALTINNKMATTSTFQCIVQTLKTIRNGKQTNSTFRYYSSAITVYNTIIIKKSNYTLSLPINYHRNPDIYYIYSQFGYVNVTISGYKSEPDLYPHCTYGGIHFAKNISSKHRDDKTLCNNYSLQRSVYSQWSLLILAYYQYREYTNVKVQLQISQTQCKHVAINVCHMYNYCVYHLYPCMEQGVISGFDVNSCISYLNVITRHLNLILSIKDEKFVVTFNKEPCVILQFFCTVNKYILDGSKLFRVVIPTVMHNSKITEVKASLKNHFYGDNTDYAEVCFFDFVIKKKSINNHKPMGHVYIKTITRNCQFISMSWGFLTQNFVDVKIAYSKRGSKGIEMATFSRYLLNFEMEKALLDTAHSSIVLHFDLTNVRKEARHALRLLIKYQDVLANSFSKYVTEIVLQKQEASWLIADPFYKKVFADTCPHIYFIYVYNNSNSSQDSNCW